MEKDRKYHHIGRSERLEISILLGKGYSRRKIASALGRSHSSVVREIKNRLVGGNEHHQSEKSSKTGRLSQNVQKKLIRECAWETLKLTALNQVEEQDQKQVFWWYTNA